MAIVLKIPPAELRQVISRRYAFEPHVSILEEAEQQAWHQKLQQYLPEIDRQIEVDLLSIWSYNRWSHIFKHKGHQVVVDDELNRHTMQSLESYYYLRDRPLIPWVYFSLIFSEFIAAGGYPNKLQLSQNLYQIARISLSQEVDTHGIVRRPALIAKMVAERVQGKDRVEQLQAEASEIYPSFHEIGHLIFEKDEPLREAGSQHIRSLIEHMFTDSTVGDAAIQYWSGPSIHDPRYGTLRVKQENQQALDERLRREVIEELFCDWFASALLLLSPPFRDLSVLSLLEMVMRNQSWRQLFTDARTELKHIATVRKRWRPIVHDSTAFRQQLLLPLLFDMKLSKAVFGKSFASNLEKRLDSFDQESWNVRTRTSIIRRQYIRFLNLYHPLKEDIELLRRGKQLESIVQMIHGGVDFTELKTAAGKRYAMVHQLAEWGSGNSELLVQDLQKYVHEGRVEQMEVEWDGIEDLAPFMEEAYRLLNSLRRYFWLASTREDIIEANKQRTDLPKSCEEAVEKLGAYSRLSRLGIVKWMEENPQNLYMIVCLDCRAVFPFGHEALRPQLVQLDPSTPMMEISQHVHCPRCQSDNTAQTGVL